MHISHHFSSSHLALSAPCHSHPRDELLLLLLQAMAAGDVCPVLPSHLLLVYRAQLRIQRTAADTDKLTLSPSSPGAPGGPWGPGSPCEGKAENPQRRWTQSGDGKHRVIARNLATGLPFLSAPCAEDARILTFLCMRHRIDS